jgi:hypothetical protein
MKAMMMSAGTIWKAIGKRQETELLMKEKPKSIQ